MCQGTVTLLCKTQYFVDFGKTGLKSQLMLENDQKSILVGRFGETYQRQGDYLFHKPEIKHKEENLTRIFFSNFHTRTTRLILLLTEFFYSIKYTLRMVPTNTEEFLRSLLLCGKSRS